MLRTAVRSDGTLPLGEAASRLGFVPGALVDVIVTSAGTLILAINDEPIIEAPYKALPIAPPRTTSAPVVVAPPCPDGPSEAGMRVAASRIGVAVEFYRGQIERGYRWCSGHREWHPRENFGPHKRRGLSNLCREWDRAASRKWQREHYVPAALRGARRAS